MKVLSETDIPGLDMVLGEEDATKSNMMAMGIAFFSSLYNQKKNTSMNALQLKIFCKQKNPPALKSLPPTDFNLALHIQRAYLKMMLWKVADKRDPPPVQTVDYGWEIHVLQRICCTRRAHGCDQLQLSCTG